MALSRECDYALRGLAALAAEAGARPLMLAEIAAREELPQSFLSKIFHKLLKHGLLVSHRGLQRGYTLARDPQTIPLRAILEAIEGPDLLDRCMFSHQHCGEGTPCLIHVAWNDVRPQVQAAFEKITLQDLVNARGTAAETGHVLESRRDQYP